MSFASLLPMAFVMVAGPQILSAVFLATSDNWRRNSFAFVAGAAVSITAVVTAAYLLGSGISDAGASDESLYIAVLVLLLFAMLHAYRTRKESHPPKWMGRLQTARARFAFTLGLLLLGVFPTDILTSVAVGTSLAAQGDAWWETLPFVGLTLVVLSTPAILLLAFGERAQTRLPKVREWMTTNAWVVNEVVLVFFVILTLSNLL